MRKSSQRGSVIGRVLVILLLLIVIVCGGIAFYAKTALDPVGTGENTVLITIKDGESFDNVLADLQDQKIIKSKEVAKVYAKFKDVSYYAGNYTFNDGMSLDEVFAALSDSTNAHTESISVTIPEGKWAKQIAEILSDKFDYTQDDFLEAWNDKTYLKTLCEDYDFLNYEDINNSQYKVKLEGYLFPETYSFDSNATIDEITRTFLDQFDVMYQKYKSDFDKSDLSIHQIVTLASIVQFESGSEEDMATIASVFYNRLDDGMTLGSSVTVCYALYDDFNDPTDCETNTDIDSPYNTYIHTGLPIGPILNAGEAAFKATLHPADTDYYYFLADINGDGKVYFFKTAEEHAAKQEELGLVY